MKNSKKIIAAALAAITVTAMTGCGGGAGGTSGGGKPADTKNKTTLNVGVVNAGTGYAWAEKVARAFEEKYANVSFEEGKTGVYVDINPQKSEFTPTAIEAAIKNEQNAEDIYFTTYLLEKSLAKKGVIANIDDIVYEKAYTANGEIAEYDPTTKTYIGATQSIYDKMADVHKVSHNLSESVITGGGFYSLPYEDHLSGFIYDYDLFKEKGWLSYDGIDGLPDTEDDFFDLMDRIVDAGMIPYVTGNVSWYMADGFQDAFFAQYEGYENAELCYTYDGEYTFAKDDLPSSIVNEIKSEEWFEETADGYKVQITAENAWILIYQPSKSAYARFMRKLTDPKYFDYKNYFKGTFSYSEAQQTFIMSKLGKQNQQRIAMIQEGEWWENEARFSFNYTGGYGSREFRFFPLPEIEGQKTDTRSLGNYSRGTDIVVNAKTKQLELCKLFLQYVHSESALETFTMETGTTRMYKYDLSDEQLKNLTPFGRNVYEIKLSGKSQVTIYTATDETCANDFYKAGEYTMGGMGCYLRCRDASGNMIWEDTFTALLNRSGAPGSNSTKMSYEDYMAGLYRYFNKADWEAAYKSTTK